MRDFVYKGYHIRFPSVGDWCFIDKGGICIHHMCRNVEHAKEIIDELTEEFP